MNEESKATLGFSELPPEVLVTVFSKIPSIKGFLNSNPESYLTKLKCPVLAVYGDKDVQVPSKENIKSLKKALKQGKNEDYTIKEIPNLNHLFQRCKTGYPSEYQKIKETMSFPVLDLITEWISEKTK